MNNQPWPKTLLEYIWIDGYSTLRSKTKRVSFIKSVEQFDMDTMLWNYDGSSTNQSQGKDSEVILKPVYICMDPFRGKNDYLVLCEAFLPDGMPAKCNYRSKAKDIFDTYKELEPMYGIEQEFFISKNSKPIGILGSHMPEPQQDYYCGVGGDNAIGRMYVAKALENCIKANLSITGMNAEVAPSQWEIQLCTIGIEAADQLIIMRYIINRTLETFGLTMDLNPKPINGDWNGSGCHVNFSTKRMREEECYDYIMGSIKNLGSKHKESIKLYGDNKQRLTGEHETSHIDIFSWGVADRSASVRIPRDTVKNKKGYFEDRRPSSNMDPYLVTSSLLKYIH